MKELTEWLNANKIAFRQVDNEVVEIEEFGRVFLADLSGVQSIFRGSDVRVEFNLMESPEILMAEGINHVAFPFGRNWYYYDLREPFRFNILKYIGKRQPSIRDIPFVNLGVHTPYELLNGSGDLSIWVQKAKYLGQTAIGICDRNTMSATLNLQKECAKAEIKHVFGYSFTLWCNEQKVDMKVYCQSQQGLQNLLRIQKEIMVDSPENVFSIEGLLSHAQGNVLVFGTLSSFWMQHNPHILIQLEERFERVFYQVDLSEYKAERIDYEALEATKFFFDNFHDSATGHFVVEPILISDCYYPDKDDAQSKVILNKIASGAAHRQSDDQHFKDMDGHFAAFEALFDAGKWDVGALFERMCRHTVEVAEGATAKFETGRMYMPQYIMLPEEIEKYGDRHTMFLRLLDEGLQAKVATGDHTRYRERLAEEVYIIESTNNLDYFLIQWDMIREAHRRGIVTGVGRGSAGGSLVSYLLGIISIDPLKYDLLFSRFLVPERCGLNWQNEVTVVGQDVRIGKGEHFVEVTLNDQTYRLIPDAELIVMRGEKRIKVKASELIEGDEVQFDQRDLIWTLNELTDCKPE